MSKNILIIEKNKEDGLLRKDILESSNLGYSCDWVSNLDEAQTLITSKELKALLVDKQLEEFKFYTNIKKLKIKNPYLQNYFTCRNAHPPRSFKSKRTFCG